MYKHKLKLLVALLMSVSAQMAYADFVGGIPSGYTCTGTCGTAGADGDVTDEGVGAE